MKRVGEEWFCAAFVLASRDVFCRNNTTLMNDAMFLTQVSKII